MPASNFALLISLKDILSALPPLVPSRSRERGDRALFVYMVDTSLPVRNEGNLFVTKSGAFYIIKSTGQQKVKLVQTPQGFKIMHNGIKGHIAVNIYVEKFRPDYNGVDDIKCLVKDNRIVPESIRFIKRTSSLLQVLPKDISISLHWKCKQRADSANQRANESIFEIDVLAAIKRDNFKCHYCLDALEPHKWHLDHYVALSRGGKNVSSNLVAACALCNVMKGALEGESFIRKCVAIAKSAEHYDLGYKHSIYNNSQTGLKGKVHKTVKNLKYQINNHAGN